MLLKDNITQLITHLKRMYKIEGYNRYKVSSPSGNGSIEGYHDGIITKFFLEYQGKGYVLYGEVDLVPVWVQESIIQGVCGANWGGADHSNCPDCNTCGGGQPVDGYWDYPTEWVKIL